MTSSETVGAKSLCSICSRGNAIYTCPRCATRTCSLPCSKSHKTLQSCSGVRKKTEYVPMNKYGWGTMANDYTYLEEVGRKTAEWGLDIVKGGFLANAAAVERGNGRGRGTGARNAPRGNTRGKRDILKLQLDARNIDIEMLPQGMERRRLNQSTWDAKSKSPLLTVEFVFHFPKNTLVLSDTSVTPEFTLLTHRNKINSTLPEILQQSMSDRGKKDPIPLWVKSLFLSSENESSQLVYLIAQHTNTPLNPVAKVFYKLDASWSLSIGLRNKTFVEYPRIDVWEDGDFTGVLIETDGTFTEEIKELRPAKRRRLDIIAGHKVLNGLLGGYVSQEEEEEEDNVLGMLGNYGSDKESRPVDDADASAKGSSEEEPDSEGGGEEHVEVPTMEDVREILEAIRQDPIPEEQIHWSEGDDEIDWEESADEEEELKRALERQKAFREAG